MRRSRAVVYIADHAADPTLTPEGVAAGLGISPRALRRVLGHTALDAAGYIAHARLDLALETLRDPRLAHLSLSVVAARAGYACAADLLRAVRAATGLTPEAYRAQVLDGPRRGDDPTRGESPRRGESQRGESQRGDGPRRAARPPA
ncbi:hypothetical protein GCM10007967_15580 [Xylanimonas ulmi]